MHLFLARLLPSARCRAHTTLNLFTAFPFYLFIFFGGCSVYERKSSIRAPSHPSRLSPVFLGSRGRVSFLRREGKWCVRESAFICQAIWSQRCDIEINSPSAEGKRGTETRGEEEDLVTVFGGRCWIFQPRLGGSDDDCQNYKENARRDLLKNVFPSARGWSVSKTVSPNMTGVGCIFLDRQELTVSWI